MYKINYERLAKEFSTPCSTLSRKNTLVLSTDRAAAILDSALIHEENGGDYAPYVSKDCAPYVILNHHFSNAEKILHTLFIYAIQTGYTIREAYGKLPEKSENKESPEPSAPEFPEPPILLPEEWDVIKAALNDRVEIIVNEIAGAGVSLFLTKKFREGNALLDLVERIDSYLHMLKNAGE